MARVRVRSNRAQEAWAFEAQLGWPQSLGDALHKLRAAEGATLRAYAARLEVSSQHVSDVERGARHLTPARAAEWADKLAVPRAAFVRLALLRYTAGLGLRIRVEAA